MVYFGIPVEGPHLGAFGHVREPISAHRLANGRPCFRVTQTFGALDWYWSQRGVYQKHGALDVANHNCGDRVLAAADGSVVWVGRDPYGALGVKLNHGDGYATEYWHLASWSVSVGQRVARGQTIGRNGGTGLAYGNCHVHFVLRRYGQALDPWPLLHQPSSLPDTSVEPTRGRAYMRTPDRGSTHLIRERPADDAAVFAIARADGNTYRRRDGRYLWPNGRRYYFFGFTRDRRWARLMTAGGRRLYVRRARVVVVRWP